MRAFAEPEGIENDQAHDDRKHERRGGNCAAIAADELADAISRRVRASFERFAAKEVIDVADQRFDGFVTALGIAVHRGEAENVEVGPSGFADWRGVGGRICGGLSGAAARYERRFERIGFENGRLRFGGGAIRKIEGNAAAEEFVQNDAERIDIGLDADTIAANLFGRSVRGREEPETSAGEVGWGVNALELLRDTEIEEADGSFTFYEDIGRF